MPSANSYKSQSSLLMKAAPVTNFGALFCRCCQPDHSRGALCLLTIAPLPLLTCRHVVVLSFSMVAVMSTGTPPQPSTFQGWPCHSATKPACDGQTRQTQCGGDEKGKGLGTEAGDLAQNTVLAERMLEKAGRNALHGIAATGQEEE